ncbi:MAG: YitT family protein [Clostridia bacterium]|nr:YitT family protein [Clostridia bacterium]
MGKIKSYLITIFGAAITGASVSLFYLPNKIVSGGVSGISTICYHTLGFEPGITVFVVNVLLLLLGLKALGKTFAMKTVFGAGLLSVFVQLFSYLPPVTDNVILATIFGAALYGSGIGICFAAGASTGGTDILGRLVQCKLPHFPIGKALLAVDGTIIVISLFLFADVELALFGILALFISTFAIDFIIRKLNVSKLAFIVSGKGEEIAQKLVSTSPRGVTVVNATGAYTKEDVRMLVCALKESEIPQFQEKILEIDSDAFIIFSESTQIVGNGFYVYR